MAREKLEIDACVGSELKDTQGETLSVEGADITELEAGRGKWNDNHGKGFFNSLGRITGAKKIFKAEDCENDRQKYYWDKLKAPYIYAKGYLYDDEDHSNAKAAAAIIRNIHKTDAPLKVKASVEGGVIARGVKDPSLLARTKIHSVALTFTPANNATSVEPISLQKSIDVEADMQLIKSVMHLAQENVPSFRHITRNASAQKIIDNVEKIREIALKTGMEMNITEQSAEQLVKNAIFSKVHSNIKKINELIKAKRLPAGLIPKTKPSTSVEPSGKMDLLPQKVTEHRQNLQENKRSQFQRDIKSLKSQPTVPKVKQAVSDTASQPLLTGPQLKQQTTLKSHASKAMKDKTHLLTIRDSLAGRGVPEGRISKILQGIVNHMDTEVKKSDDSASIGKIVRNVAITAALATAAHSFKKPEAKEKPAKVIEVKPSLKDISSRSYKGPFKEDEEIKEDKKLNKALTAGFGAGTPTDFTGGGVMQSESLEDTFKYTTCDSCGKEQIYTGNQVRCRECGKGFSMKKIYSMIS